MIIKQNNKFRLFTLILLLIAIVACQKKPELERSMKGYELYSWQDDEQWYFSLVIGTNRMKTFEEVTAKDVRIKGLDALVEELERLPEGEPLFWTAGLVTGTELPPADMIEIVEQACQDGNIQLEMSSWPAEDGEK